MDQSAPPPSQSWKTFFRNHLPDSVSVDFFCVPTATFKILYVFLVLSNHRRRVLHFNVTDSPTAAWTGRQLIQAFPWDCAPKYLIRDRDNIYGAEYRRAVVNLAIEEIRIAPRSPWQNPYVERMIGTLRRECLDHMIVWGPNHLRRILRQYLEYYHHSRTHLGLDKDCPVPRDVEPPEAGEIHATPHLGGLHHRYYRRAA